MRVIEIAATICWGLAALASLQLPPVTPPKPAASPAVPDPVFPLAWHVPLPQPISTTHMTASATMVFVADATSGIHAFSAAEGKRLWSRPLTTTAPPASAGDLVVLFSEATVRVLDAKTGDDRWSAPAEAPAHGVTLDADRVIAASGSTVRAWRHDGTSLWEQPLTAVTSTRPAIDGPRVFIALEESAIAALNVDDGILTWKTTVPARPRQIIAFNERVYFGADNGTFYAYDQSPRPDPLWAFPLRAETIGMPAYDDRCVYAALMDNTVRAMRRTIGNLCWGPIQLNRRPAAGPLRAGDRLAIPTMTGEIVGLLVASGKDAGPVAIVPGGKADQPARLIASAPAPDASMIYTLTIASDTPPTLAAFRTTAAGSGKNR